MNKDEKREAYLAYRIRILPEQLERARKRVKQLENEARRLGFHDLLGEEK